MGVRLFLNFPQSFFFRQFDAVRAILHFPTCFLKECRQIVTSQAFSFHLFS